MNAATKIQRAKIALLLDEPFFGALLLNLRFSPDVQGTETKTMATDGRRLIWHPAFVDTMTEQETKTVLAHEALHCALLHMLRRGDRDDKAWNVACVTGNVPILMTDGTSQPASTIRAGQTIATPFGATVVSRVLQKRSSSLVRVRFEDRFLDCTANHPIIGTHGRCENAGSITEATCYTTQALDHTGKNVSAEELAQVFNAADSRHLGTHLQDLLRASPEIGFGPEFEIWAGAKLHHSNCDVEEVAPGLFGWIDRRGRNGFNSSGKGERQHLFSTGNFHHDDVRFASAGSFGAGFLLSQADERCRGDVFARIHFRLAWLLHFIESLGTDADNQKATSPVASEIVRMAFGRRLSAVQLLNGALATDGGIAPRLERQKPQSVEELAGTATVYDFVTDVGCYIASGVMVHNCDHAVNLHLDSVNTAAIAKGRSAPFPWPKLNVYKDPQHVGKCAEEIYSDVPPGGGNGGPDDQGMGGVMDAPGDEAQAQELEANWKVALTQAAAAAKMQGKLPGDMARLVDETLNPPSRWQDILRAFIRENAADDYSFARPNRRYLQTGFILPGLFSQRLGRITVAIDTSGSITPELLNMFLGEVEAIASECRPSCIELIDCDAQINSVRECDPADPLPREFAGGGGTDFSPVFDHIEQAQEKPVCVIYFTDLYGSFPADPGLPVLWAVYGDNAARAPFGETIKVA